MRALVALATAALMMFVLAAVAASAATGPDAIGRWGAVQPNPTMFGVVQPNPRTWGIAKPNPRGYAGTAAQHALRLAASRPDGAVGRW